MVWLDYGDGIKCGEVTNEAYKVYLASLEPCNEIKGDGAGDEIRTRDILFYACQIWQKHKIKITREIGKFKENQILWSTFLFWSFESAGGANVVPTAFSNSGGSCAGPHYSNGYNAGNQPKQCCRY